MFTLPLELFSLNFCYQLHHFSPLLYFGYFVLLKFLPFIIQLINLNPLVFFLIRILKPVDFFSKQCFCCILQVLITNIFSIIQFHVFSDFHLNFIDPQVVFAFKIFFLIPGSFKSDFLNVNSQLFLHQSKVTECGVKAIL